MVDRIRGPQGTKLSERTKGTRKPGEGSVSFADLLSQAEKSGDISSPGSPSFPMAYAPLALEEDEKKKSFLAKEKSENILAALQEMAEDVLAGSGTVALGKLKAYLGASTQNEQDLTPEQKKALDELQTRAAVAAAKMEK